MLSQGVPTPDHRSDQIDAPAEFSAPFKFDHGRFEVSVISDGHLLLPTALLAPEAPVAERKAILRSGGSDGAEYEPAANIALIQSGQDLILFDTGGAGYQPHLGMLSANLFTAGIDAAKVTKVVFTHGHPDHIWGTVLDDGTLRFPNAAFYSGATEWDFWTSDVVWTSLPVAQHPFAVGAQRQYAAVRDRITMLRAGDQVAPGIRAFNTPGHTPGHMSFEVAGGDGLIIVGDTITAPSVYFPHPEWTFGFDFDPAEAVTTRKRFLDRAASDRSTLLGYHWPYPGVGYVERRGSAYSYAAVRASMDNQHAPTPRFMSHKPI